MLEAYQRVSTLVEEREYTGIRRDIRRELSQLGLLRGDTATFASLRQNRGKLLRPLPRAFLGGATRYRTGFVARVFSARPAATSRSNAGVRRRSWR